jgi:hypothetical protein
MGHNRASPAKTRARPQELISYERLKELVSTCYPFLANIIHSEI